VFVIVAIAFYLLRDDRTFGRWFTARFADERSGLDEYLTVVEDVNNILLVYVPVAISLFAVPVMRPRPGMTWFPITFAAASFVVVDAIPDLALRPYVSGRSRHIGASMLAYILGPLLFGRYGLFLAPMLLVLVVHFVRIVMPERIAGRPTKPYAVDPTYRRSSTSRLRPTTSTGLEGAALLARTVRAPTPATRPSEWTTAVRASPLDRRRTLPPSPPSGRRTGLPTRGGPRSRGGPGG
jgi:predicted PurR-regulated permease PerM